MYETSHRVLCADARRLEPLADESVGLVVTSPPYPMIAMWDREFARLDPEIAARLEAGDGVGAHELMHRALDPAWRELYRVLRPGALACINIGDATRSVNGAFRLYANQARLTSALLAAGFDALPPILWRKPTNSPTKFMGSGMLPAGAYVTLEHEHILIVRKGGPRRFPGEEAKARRRSAFFWEERNAWFSDVWELRGSRQQLDGAAPRARSGAFPFELAFRLAAMFSVEGDVVLDPFAGTGTTLWAAVAARRSSVCIEIEPELARSALAPLALPDGARSIRDELNAYLRERLARHESFARDARAADGRPLNLRHRNRPHGFPVMTSQEVELRIDFVESLRLEGEACLIAGYEPAPVPTEREAKEPAPDG